MAGLCLAGLVLTWVLAALVPATHVRDAVALTDIARLDRPVVEALGGAVLLLLDPALYALWAIVLVAVAFHRRLPRLALVVLALAVLSPLSAELLKPLLAHPHAHLGYLHIKAASWPSGHSTAGLTLAWCAVLLSPPGRRAPVALLGGAFALVVGCCLLILAWHMPSDVLGGYLLASLWAALAYAALDAAP